jgi:polysaccharide export outer membrane protein
MRAAFATILLLVLCGCGSLPHDGPSAHAIPREAAKEAARYALIDLDYGVTQQIADHPAAALVGLANDSSNAPTDLIAEGDILSVTVFESTSSSLFGRPVEVTTEDSPTGASQQNLPKLTVDSDGDLSVPFGGTVHVAGLPPRQAAEAIRKALGRRAVNPQVTVSVEESRANSVAVIGEVHNPGHFRLSANNDRILDALASAGGPAKPVADLAVDVYRGSQHAEAPLAVLMTEPSQNIRLAPHDQIRVLSRPRKYTTFGAFSRVDQTAIEDDNLTLAQAMGRAGGLDTYSASAASVLVFRFERPEVAHALGVNLPPAAKGIPIVYRLNYRKPDRIFVADNFYIQSGDLLYVPRSDITELKKFFDLVNSVTQIGYNVRVTSAIPQ